MRSLCTALVLATLTIGQVLAGPTHHAYLHRRKAIAGRDVDVTAEKREASADLAERQILPRGLSSTAASRLAALSCQTGINSYSDNGGVWIGSGGAYTNNFVNAAGQDVILVVWGPDASWVNVHQPLVTIELPAGASQIISFASGSIGAWSAIYSDTTTYYGQIVNTWGEYTMSPMGVVDVSREVNMSGHTMSIAGPQCTTDMNNCVFVCGGGENSCMTNYELLNCAAGSQPGAQYGTYGGFPSGGCGGLGDSAALTTTLS